MRNVFFLGKGGVGKSSLSILSALYLSSLNKSVALISLDRAHNLNDILNTPTGELPSALTVIEANLDAFIQKFLKQTENQLRKSYNYLTAINLEQHFKILRYAPGMEEYGLLIAFQHFSEKFQNYDYLIFDMPPTALALKFFGLPAVSLVWLKQLRQLRDEILKKKEIISGVKFGKKTIETDKVKHNLEEQQKKYGQLLSFFQNSGQCAMNVVSNFDPVSLAESERIFNFFNDLNIQVHKLIINKSTEREEISAKFRILKKSNPTFLPQSTFPLIGLRNLEKYLNRNQKIIGSITDFDQKNGVK